MGEDEGGGERIRRKVSAIPLTPTLSPSGRGKEAPLTPTLSPSGRGKRGGYRGERDFSLYSFSPLGRRDG